MAKGEAAVRIGARATCLFAALLTLTTTPATAAGVGQGQEGPRNPPAATGQPPPQAVVQLTTLSRSMSLGEHVEILRDPQRSLDIDAVRRLPREQWQRHHDEALNLRHQDIAWWVRLAVANDTAVLKSLVLHVDWPLLDSLDVYVLRNGVEINRWQVGDQRPFANRPVAATAFAFPVDVPAGVTFDIVMRFDLGGGGLELIPVTLWEPVPFFKSQQDKTLVLAGYFGAITAICIYVMLLFISTRERGFLYYASYLSAFSIWIVGFVGFGNQYLWTDAFWWNNLYGIGTSVPVVVLSVLFVTDFLESHRRAPALHRAMWGAALLDLVPLVAVLARSSGALVPMRPFFLLHVSVVVLTMFLAVGTATMMSLRGFRRALFLVVGWSFLTAAVLLYMASQIAGLLPSTVPTKYTLVIGSSLEFLLLSLAAGERFRALREAALVAERKNVELKAAQMSELETQVEERTRQLQVALAENNRLARTDEVTGLANRRAFNETIDREIRRGRRERTPLAFCLVDIDAFKRFNDTYGHLAGDQALRRVGRCLSSAMRRPADYAFRLGGEEFGLVLAGPANSEQCLEFIEALRASIAAMAIPHADHPAGVVTASFGLVICDDLAGQTGDALMNTADGALYRAKDAGKNRVEVVRL